MKSRYSAVFWDWNGTIVDDLEVNFSVINLLLDKYVQKSISMEDYRKSFCFPIIDFYRNIGLPVDSDKYEQIVHDYWDLYRSQNDTISLTTGILDIIKTLKLYGVNQFVLSASPKNAIVSQMSKYSIQSYFDGIISPIDGYAKGKIELARQRVAEHDIPLSNIVMIGDTLHDYDTANAVGIDCILINCGHQDLTKISNAAKLTVIGRICDLKSILYG